MSGGEPSSIKRWFAGAAASLHPYAERHNRGAHPRGPVRFPVWCPEQSNERQVSACIEHCTANGAPAALRMWWASRPSSPRCKTRSVRAGSDTPTCLPARGEPAKPPAPRSLPRRSTAWIPPAPTRAGNARSARALMRVRSWMFRRSTRPPTTVWTTSGTCGKRRPTCRRCASIRCTSSTRSTCSPLRPSTPCSRRWRNRRNTSSSSWLPPKCKRSRPPSCPAASGMTSPGSRPGRSPAGWNMWPGRKRSTWTRLRRN